LFCGVVWLVAYGFFRRRWLHRKILQVFPSGSDVRREIKHSAVSVVMGHSGFEVFPRWMMKSWLGRVLSTPTHHVMHHEKMRGNYGLYFNMWDRLMKTNHQDYETRFAEVVSRPQQKE
jgi:hypothetical protein